MIRTAVNEFMCWQHAKINTPNRVIIFFPFSGGEDIFVGVGDNTILQCDEAKHQAVASVEWFCRCENYKGTFPCSKSF